MTFRILATTLAASLALTVATAVPVRAGDDDLAKFAIGAASIIVLGAVLSESSVSRGGHHHHYHSQRNNCRRVIRSYHGDHVHYSKRYVCRQPYRHHHHPHHH